MRLINWLLRLWRHARVKTLTQMINELSLLVERKTSVVGMMRDLRNTREAHKADRRSLERRLLKEVDKKLSNLDAEYVKLFREIEQGKGR